MPNRLPYDHIFHKECFAFVPEYSINMFPATLRQRPITAMWVIMLTLSTLPLSSFAFVAVVVHPHFPRTTTTTSMRPLPSPSSLKTLLRMQQRPTHHTNDDLVNTPMASSPSFTTKTTATTNNPPLTKSTQPTPAAWSAFLPQHHRNMASLAAVLTIVLSTVFVSNPADAAMSGGRMGGSFSSRPSSSSFRGGGGGSRMNMSPGLYTGGGGYNYYGGGSRTTIVAPIISPFAATPFYNPIVPYYGGGVGAISYARGPGLFDLLFLGGIGFFVLSTISNTLSSQSSSSSSFGQWDDASNNMLGLSSSTSSATTTVVKCNVALDVSNRDDPRSILSVLDRMAKVTAKTDTRQGVMVLTQQVAMELLRRKSSIYSAAGAIQQYKNDKEAQRTYNQWSVQERSKFEQENVNKFNQFDLSLVKPKDDSNPSLSVSSKATMAVVTLVLSFDGSMNGNNNNNSQPMKQIQSWSDLETVLQAVASMNQDASSLYGAEILWTPEDRSETLTKKEILADYPELNVL